MRLLTTILIFLFVAQAGYSQQHVIDSLQKIAEKHSGDTVESTVLAALTREFLRKDMTTAAKYAWAQKSLSTRLNYPTGLASAYGALITVNQNTGKLDSARYYLKTFGALAETTSDINLAIEYNNMAGLFHRDIGEQKTALPYLMEALRLIGPNGDKTRRAGQLLNIGNTFNFTGEFLMSAKYHLEALALFEEVGNKRGQSFSLQGLGGDYKGLDQYQTALGFYLRSEKIKEELGDKRGLLTAWLSLGAVYQDMRQYERSLQYTTKGLAAAREQKMTLSEMSFLFNLGSINKEMNKTAEAKRYYNESLKLAIAAGDSLLVSRIKTDLIVLDTDARREKIDERVLVKNVQIAMEKGDRKQSAEGHERLAEWYARNGRFEKAFAELAISHELYDSIRGADIMMQVKRMEEEYLGDKKDREIALLRKDQELQTLELSRQNTALTAIAIALASVVIISLLLVNRYRVMNKAKRDLEVERVRNNIARDLHDEMGSALSSINILSKVALVEQNGNAQQYLQRIGDQSARMMENMGDMVWSINPRNDTIEQLITRMREFAAEILDPKNIDYVFTENLPADLTIDTDKRKNLFMIFKEAVNNAAKYSNATAIEINLSQNEGQLVLNIKDNGKGFEEQGIKAGNGLRNMRERAGESGGSILIKSGPGKGTEVQMQLSIA